MHICSDICISECHQYDVNMLWINVFPLTCGTKWLCHVTPNVHRQLMPSRKTFHQYSFTTDQGCIKSYNLCTGQVKGMMSIHVCRHISTRYTEWQKINSPTHWMSEALWGSTRTRLITSSSQALKSPLIVTWSHHFVHYCQLSKYTFASFLFV